MRAVLFHDRNERNLIGQAIGHHQVAIGCYRGVANDVSAAGDRPGIRLLHQPKLQEHLFGMQILGLVLQGIPR